MINSGVDGFTKIRVLGQGGFGKVYQVKNEKDGRQYALKAMNDHKFTDQKVRANILQSAENEFNVLKELNK